MQFHTNATLDEHFCQPLNGALNGAVLNYGGRKGSQNPYPLVEII